jgi:hypothetical protein
VGSLTLGLKILYANNTIKPGASSFTPTLLQLNSLKASDG